MAEEAVADPTASRELESNLKEFDTPFKEDEFVKGIFEDIKEPEPAKAEPEAEAEPEKGDDAPAEDEPPEKDIFKEGLTPEDEPEPEKAEPEDAPPDLSEAGKADWKALKASKGELKTKFEATEKAREALATEVEELRKGTADLVELRKQKEDFDEAQKELAISRVEGRKDYKEAVVEPLKAIEDQIVIIAKSSDVTVAALDDAIGEPDPVKRRALLKEVTEDMDNVDQAEVFQMAKDAQAILTKRDEIRSKAQEAAKESKENAAAKEEADTRKTKDEYERASDHVVSELRKRIPFESLAEGETEDGVYAAALEQVKSSDFDGAPVDRKALYVATTILMPRLTKQLVEAQKEIKKLKGRVDKKRSASPRIGGDAPDPPAEGFDGDVEAAVAAHFGESHEVPLLERLKNF
jgi:hypothetical protein